MDALPLDAFTLDSDAFDKDLLYPMNLWTNQEKSLDFF